MAVISEFTAAVNQICAERGISADNVYEALESAILAAYKREYGEGETLKVEINRDTGEIKLIADKEVVSEVTETDSQILLSDAVKMEPNLEVGDHVEIEIPMEGFGRIATQAAKQVILQKMRESEKDAVLAEFREKIGTVITGLVQRMIGPTAEVEIGKAVAHMPPEEQIPNEFYRIGERYKFYLKEIRDEQELIVSRAAPEFLIELFSLEVPEMESGIVEVKAVAREAGSRSKVAVISHQEGVDPIGSCVGQKGMRIANVMSELSDEKIDIIEWAEGLEQFIANALGPARVEKVELLDDSVARVHVADDQLSLAIGRDGQNVRLAAKLTNMKIDITAPGLDESRRPGHVEEAASALSPRVMKSLEKAGISIDSLMTMEEKDIISTKGIGKVAQKEILAYRAANKASVKTKSEENKPDGATTQPVDVEVPETEVTTEETVKKDTTKEKIKDDTAKDDATEVETAGKSTEEKDKSDGPTEKPTKKPVENAPADKQEPKK